MTSSVVSSRTARAVEAVVAGVDQVMITGCARVSAGLAVRRARAKATAGETQGGGDREVALALVDVDRLLDVREAVCAEPLQVGRRLRFTLRCANRAPSTRPSTTVAPFAAKTMFLAAGRGAG